MGMTRSTGSLPSGSFTGSAILAPQVVQRTAAERREAGAEYQAGICEVGVGDDAFGHHRLRFLEIRRKQALDQLLRDCTGRALYRFALAPGVIAAPAFLAEVPRSDQALQLFRQRRRGPDGDSADTA